MAGAVCKPALPWPIRTVSAQDEHGFTANARTPDRRIGTEQRVALGPKDQAAVGSPGLGNDPVQPRRLPQALGINHVADADARRINRSDSHHIIVNEPGHHAPARDAEAHAEPAPEQVAEHG